MIACKKAGTRRWGISSVGRASVLHAEGHRFEPGILQVKQVNEHWREPVII
jgi:hypothetical protein